MAWSDEARRAAAEARRMHRRHQLYDPVPAGHGEHLPRREMARDLREARRYIRKDYPRLTPALRNQAAVREVTHSHRSGRRVTFTNVKGAHFVDQGMRGQVWRYARSTSDPRGAV